VSWFGLRTMPDNLICATIKLVIAVSAVALLVLLGTA
jgi:hypothetical protein